MYESVLTGKHHESRWDAAFSDYLYCLNHEYCEEVHGNRAGYYFDKAFTLTTFPFQMIFNLIDGLDDEMALRKIQ